jgi:hypothetical protein
LLIAAIVASLSSLPPFKNPKWLAKHSPSQHWFTPQPAQIMYKFWGINLLRVSQQSLGILLGTNPIFEVIFNDCLELECFKNYRKILRFSAGQTLETMSGKMIERSEIEFKTTSFSVSQDSFAKPTTHISSKKQHKNCQPHYACFFSDFNRYHKQD